MKKIVKRTGNIRLKGMADKNGIAFQATKEIGAILFFSERVIATIDEEQVIQKKTLNRHENNFNMDAKINKLSGITIKVTCILGILFFMTSIVYAFKGSSLFNVSSCLFFIMMAVIGLYKGATIFGARILGNEEIKSFSKFLAAKNAVRNAYYDLQRIPNLEETKEYSSFSYNSKYLKSTYVPTILVFTGVALLATGIWYWVIAILGIIISLVLEKKNKLFFWQFLIVSKPEDIHYQVAIEALEGCLEKADFTTIHTIFGNKRS